MQLDGITIKNYKLCKNVTIEINDSLTVLLGKNGTGKTTLLQALSLFSKMSDKIHPKSSREEKNDYDLSTIEAQISDSKNKYTLLLTAYFEKNTITTTPHHYAFSLKINNSKKIYEYSDFEYYFYIFRLDSKSKSKTIRLPSKSKTYHIMKEVADFIQNVSYYSTTDFLNGKNNDTILDVAKSIKSHFNTSNTKFLLDLYELSEADPTSFERYRGIVSRTGSGLIDDVKFNSIPIPSSSVKAYKNGMLTTVEEIRNLVVPVFSINGNQLYNNQLSEGTFRILALIFYILNNRSNILIIEEPELSIHLELLGDVIELIKEASKSKQIVISTHSERIVNMLDLKDIVIISRGSDGIKAGSIHDRFNPENINSLKNYLNDGGTLGEFLLGEY